MIPSSDSVAHAPTPDGDPAPPAAARSRPKPRIGSAESEAADHRTATARLTPREKISNSHGTNPSPASSLRHQPHHDS
ncbi:hypothetical protein GCM10023205_50730 [Yinghuangia aomiensis]|uniref:Uncharacterized protein n=1 Tax=Yinghuangia aomiensis TaxID=676205 RepID=A0ABP9HRW2_9ACTN